MKRKLDVTEKEFSPMYFTSAAEKAVTKKMLGFLSSKVHTKMARVQTVKNRGIIQAFRLKELVS